MKGTLIILGIIGCALARPDIGLQLREQGYHFQPPATSYGVPSGSYLPPNSAGLGGEHHHHHEQSINGGGNGGQSSFGQGGGNGGQSSFGQGGGNGGQSSFGQGGGNVGQGGGNFGQSSFGSSVYDVSQGGSGGHDHHAAGGHDHGFGSSGSGFVGQDFSSHSGGTTGGFSGFQGSSLSSGSQTQSGTADIQKHVYFFDAPDDEPAPQLRIHYQQANPKKNYRVIFIKAPSYKAPKIPEIAVQNQDQEKTVVYVLVKKQEDGQDIIIPTSAPSKPSKPDVYFIKYKTKQEAEQKIQSIQQGASSGVSANAVGSDQDFVSTIRDDSHSGGGISSGFDGHSHDHHNQITHTSSYPSQGHQESISFPSQGHGTIGTGHGTIGTGHGTIGTGHYGQTGGNGIHVSTGHPLGHEHSSSGTHISQSTTSGYNFGPAGQSGPYKKREIKL